MRGVGTDVPALATFTVSQNALRCGTVMPPPCSVRHGALSLSSYIAASVPFAGHLRSPTASTASLPHSASTR